VVCYKETPAQVYPALKNIFVILYQGRKLDGKIHYADGHWRVTHFRRPTFYTKQLPRLLQFEWENSGILKMMSLKLRFRLFSDDAGAFQQAGLEARIPVQTVIGGIHFATDGHFWDFFNPKGHEQGRAIMQQALSGG
jgi:hypothetical protein